MIYYFVPYVLLSYRIGEVSSNAGGLIIWPAKALLLVGFVAARRCRASPRSSRRSPSCAATWTTRTPVHLGP